MDISTLSDDSIWPVFNRRILDALQLPSTNVNMPHNPNATDEDGLEYDTLDWQLYSTRKAKLDRHDARSFARHDIVGHQFKLSFLDTAFKGVHKFDNPLEETTLHIVGPSCRHMQRYHC